MTTLTLTISLSADTLGVLKAARHCLHVFRPLKSSNETGVPLVWARFGPDDYQKNTVVAFDTDAFLAYISTDAILADHAVNIGSSTQVGLGQIAYFKDDDSADVRTTAPPGDIYIGSKATTAFRCGLAAQRDAKPYCAFELAPQMLVTMRPVNAVFVMWATSPYDPGVFMRQSLGPGLFVTFDDAGKRDVSYDSKNGWLPSDAVWGRPVDALADLVGTLILDPGPNHPEL